MAVHDGGLQQAQVRHGYGGRGRKQRDEVALNAFLNGLQAERRLIAEAGEDVEGELLVVDGFVLLFEAEQRDGLLLQLFDAGHAALAGGLECRDNGAPQRAGGSEALQDGRDGNGGGMGDNVQRRVDGVTGRFRHGGAQARGGVIFQRTGEVNNDGRAGAWTHLRECLLVHLVGSREEDNARGVQLIGVDGSDDDGLVFCRAENRRAFLSRAEQLQARAENAFAQQLAQVGAEQRFTADDGHLWNGWFGHGVESWTRPRRAGGSGVSGCLPRE